MVLIQEKFLIECFYLLVWGRGEINGMSHNKETTFKAKKLYETPAPETENSSTKE